MRVWSRILMVFRDQLPAALLGRHLEYPSASRGRSYGWFRSLALGTGQDSPKLIHFLAFSFTASYEGDVRVSGSP